MRKLPGDLPTVRPLTVVGMPSATLKANQAYDTLRREIVSCRLLPGTRFTETELMDRFALGKASCRIALQHLT